jgi:hypothetical protein
MLAVHSSIYVGLYSAKVLVYSPSGSSQYEMSLVRSKETPSVPNCLV